MHPMTRERITYAAIAGIMCVLVVFGLFSLFIKAGCP